LLWLSGHSRDIFDGGRSRRLPMINNTIKMQEIISFKMRDHSFGQRRFVDFILAFGGARLPS
jgi:hypothetical protein